MVLRPEPVFWDRGRSAVLAVGQILFAAVVFPLGLALPSLILTVVFALHVLHLLMFVHSLARERGIMHGESAAEEQNPKIFPEGKAAAALFRTFSPGKGLSAEGACGKINDQKSVF